MQVKVEKIVLATQKLVWPFSIALVILFLLFATIFATSNPLCCADDASIAVVSKNLASGLGYFSTVNYWGSDLDYSGVLFDPGISTGATSVLPVAIGVYLFGPFAPVPGLVHIALYSLIFAALASRIRSAYGEVIAGGIMALFVLLILSTSAYHFEHWYAQLGEALAAMLIILGAAVLAISSPGYRGYFLSGLLMGGAVLTKQLAALYVVGACLVVLYECSRATNLDRGIALKQGLVFFIGICVPILFFELWKIWVLGLGGWLDNWRKFYQFLLHSGVEQKGHDSVSQLLLDRLNIVRQRFFVSPYALSLALIVYPFVLVSLPIYLRRFSVLLLFGFILHVVYWLGWSIGWPRYIYMAVIVGAFLLSIAQVASRRRASRIVITLSIVMVVFSGLPKIDWQFPMHARKEGNARSAQLVASYIELKHPLEHVHTQWWAHTAALEYLSSMPLRYSNWNEPRNRFESNRLVITDLRFLLKDDANFMAYIADSCTVDVAYGTYTLYLCR